VSRIKTPAGGAISRAGRRFDQNNYLYTGWRNTPGPGKYEPRLEFRNDGHYSFSKWRSSGAPKFNHQKRVVDLDTSVTRKSKLDLF